MVKVKKKRRPKLDLEYMRKFFADHDCTLHTKIYLGTKQLLKYRCNICKHWNSACYNNLYRISPDAKKKYFCTKCYLNKFKHKATKRIVLRNKMYSITDAAAWLGVNLSDFYKHIRYKKTLPAPTRVATASGLNKFYSESDLQEIKKLIC